MLIFYVNSDIACLTLTRGYKIRDMSPPACSMKLKIISGSEMSKTVNLDVRKMF